ncbi:unnamed protein product [Schistosoma mattheei]|uniref:Uncharacterized protein n=1 Tax=Schistosoma mattheei TaxID=31246 RepID=A0A3P8EV22_9TREM|nr:unnamed protein product [Schistosoma mattheei]
MRWLGHVLRMPEHGLPRRVISTSVMNGWKIVRGGRTKTWHHCSKSLTSSLSHFAVRSVLLYSCEMWPLRVEDIRKLLVFDHKYLRNIARICWDHRVSNSEVRHRVLGNRWLGHVLRMPEHRLPRRAMLTSVMDG